MTSAPTSIPMSVSISTLTSSLAILYTTAPTVDKVNVYYWLVQQHF